ncbi:MAG TPA: DUF6152 family protein [Gammaproteobacteria bacterium]|jgi:hypothetical protein
MTASRWLAGMPGLVLVGLLGLAIPLFALAHHSFAVHYDGSRTISVAGVVEEFRFRNPHGMIVLNGAGADGVTASWKIETNSPNILRRRGWTPESIAAGDEVVIEGFPSNDGSNSMRVYRVQFADGRELIGQRPAVGIEQ